MGSKIGTCLGSRSASGVASGMESMMITGRPSILRVSMLSKDYPLGVGRKTICRAVLSFMTHTARSRCFTSRLK